MNNTLFVGIDISKRSNVATFMNCEGKVVGRLTFSNSGSGADRLVAKILSYYEREILKQLGLAWKTPPFTARIWYGFCTSTKH